jgi:predicted amidohydrolase
MGPEEEAIVTSAEIGTVRVAAGQFSSVPGEPDKNARRIVEILTEASGAGVELVVLPECGLTGYVFDTAVAARSAAVTVNGSEVTMVAEAAAALGIYVVFGFLELTDTALHNTAMLVGPQGTRGVYRKTHLPHIGADRFVTAGENGPVLVETRLGVVGLSVCYDLRFPEWARCLALGGADIIANPTNWPAPAERVAKLFTRVRAAENHVFIIAANRGDQEHGAEFIGCSQIIDPTGNILNSIDRQDGLITADIQPAMARQKDIHIPEDDFAISLFGDRRPALYGAISEQTKG